MRRLLGVRRLYLGYQLCTEQLSMCDRVMGGNGSLVSGAGEGEGLSSRRSASAAGILLDEHLAFLAAVAEE